MESMGVEGRRREKKARKAGEGRKRIRREQKGEGMKGEAGRRKKRDVAVRLNL